MKILLITLLTAIAIGTTTHAQEQEGHERKHRGPPQVAVEACAAAVQGDTCSFEGRRGETLDGTCESPEDKPLACRPADAPPRLERNQSAPESL